MSRNYDNWEKLVGAVLRREKDRQLAFCESFASSSSVGLSSRFSFSDKSGEVRAVSCEVIRKATRNFGDDSFVGEGSRGKAYKGWIDEHDLVAAKPGFGTLVAFKMMAHAHMYHRKWMDRISHLRHPNLVTPIGYCLTSQIIYVFEFINNGRLDNYLRRYTRRGRHEQVLSWATRMKVAVGVAGVLAFLHSLEEPVIIGFIESADILLDGDFNVKLSDVGLKVDPEVMGNLEGPFGIVVLGFAGSPYAAPDYAYTEKVSAECDVYSFGIILIELITGRRAFRIVGLLKEITRNSGNKRWLSRFIDRALEGEYPYKQASEVARLALQCASTDPRSRPGMDKVFAALQKL